MSEPESKTKASSAVESPKVFISYSHDSSEHMNRILTLSNRLRAEGVDCHIDQYEDSPAEGWPRWTTNRVEDADFVLVVATETYNNRFRGKEKKGIGQGAKWEGAIITQELYETEANNIKFVPVVFSAEDVAHIPIILRGAAYYDVGSDSGYEDLYRRLTNQPKIIKPPLGKIIRQEPVKLAPVQVLERNPNFPIPDSPSLFSKVFQAPKRLWGKFWKLKLRAKLGLLGTVTGTLLLFAMTRFMLMPEEAQERAKIRWHLWPQPFTEKRWDWFDMTRNQEPDSTAWDFPEGQWKIEPDKSSTKPGSGVLAIYGSRWGVRNDFDSSKKAFYDFHVSFRVKFRQGNQAGWVFRAQPDKQSGYVFLLEERGTRLLLNAWVYTKNGPIRLGKPDTDLDFEGPFDALAYWNIDAEVKDNGIEYTVSLGTDKKLSDSDDEDPQIIKNNQPLLVPRIEDANNTYRFGNIGFFAPEGSQVMVDNYIFTPRP